MRHLRFLLPPLALIILPLLAGCLGSPELRGIAVQLTEVRATSTGDGAEVTVTVRYLNENLVAIAVSETEHQVWLNGVSLGRIESEEPVGLPQLGEASQELRLRVTASVANQLRSMQAAGTANYRLQTRLTIETARDEVKSNATGSGSVDLGGLGL